MAYVTKHPKSRYWSAVFRDGTGRQIRRSTKIEANPAAADSRERARLAIEAKRKAWRIAEAYERAGRGELQRETEVRETLMELVELAGGPRVEEQNVRAFIDKWIESSKQAGKSKTTMARYEQIARDFLKHLGDRAIAPVSHVTASDVQGFIAGILAKGRSTKTASNSLKILRIPFAEACRLGVLVFNPAAAVKPPQVVSVEREAFTPGEIKAILDACTGFPDGVQWQTAVMLGYYAAMRLGDATSLLWGNIDFDRRMIAFSPEKTRGKGRAVELPMHPELERYLLALPLSDNPAAPITPALNRLAGERSALSKGFVRLLHAAGVNNPKGRTREGAGSREVSKKSFHALRHSLTSHLAAAGVSPELRMKITGHTDTRTHAGYTHLELETLRDALARVAAAK